MKFLLLVLLFAALIWLLMRWRDDGDDRGPRDPEPPAPDGEGWSKSRRERDREREDVD